MRSSQVLPLARVRTDVQTIDTRCCLFDYHLADARVAHVCCSRVDSQKVTGHRLVDEDLRLDIDEAYFIVL